VLKRAYFMTVIDGVFCLKLARDEQTRDAFQLLSCSTGARLRPPAITPQTLWREMGKRSKPENNIGKAKLFSGASGFVLL